MTKFDIEQRRYLGNKSRLINFINESLKKEKISYKSFCDLFAGTGAVGANQLSKGKHVIFNDLLYSNYVIYNGFFGDGIPDEKKMIEIVDTWNALKKYERNYFSEKFGGKYFSNTDSMKIGHCREQLENLKNTNKINDREYYILLSSLIYSFDKIALTVGHYDAYRIDGIKNSKAFEIKLINFKNGSDCNIVNQDANVISRSINADVVYIDPPYNSRQYGDAYHLLENFATWTKPETFGKAEKMDRNYLKSEYSLSSAKIAFETLINSLNTKYIVISYNDTGMKENANSRSAAKISDEEILRILKRRGSVKVYSMEINAFNAGKTERELVHERLFICKVEKKSIYVENVKSPLNYSGGKFGILSDIKEKLPKNINTFYDVFCGALNVGINAETNKVIASDTNKELVDLLKYIKTTPTIELITKIEKNIKKYNLSNTYQESYIHYNTNSSNGLAKINKESFEKLRNAYNKKPSSELLLMLVIYGFNNMLRFNNKGFYNAPVGKRDFNNNIRSNLIAFSERLKDVIIEIKNTTYLDVNLNNISNNDFIFLDPPYWITEAVYNKTWSENEEIEMYNFLQKLVDKKIKFMLTNVLKTPKKVNIHLKNFIEFNNLKYIETKNTFSNSSYNKKTNERSIEIILTNY